MRAFLLWLCLTVPAGAADIGTLLNAERRAAGLHALQRSPALVRAAEAHALDMARKRYFSHQSSNGARVWDRVGAQGYGYCFVAENIAKGQKSPEEAMRGWMRSRGHRKNNLSKEAVHYGAARASGDYWVLVFASPGC